MPQLCITTWGKSLILEDLPWILVRTVPPLVSPQTSSDRGGCKHRKLPSLQEYHSTTWPTLLLPSSGHSQISTMHKNIDKWSKSYTARKSYHGKFRNCIKKILSLILPGGLYTFIFFVLSPLSCILSKSIDKMSKSQNYIKLLQICFALWLTVLGGVSIFFVFPTLYCNLTPTYRKAWNKQQAESINCLL